MKKNLYLHIGPGKTATTALQIFFSQNFEILKDNGILYPKLGYFGVMSREIYGPGNGVNIAKAIFDPIKSSNEKSDIEKLKIYLKNSEYDILLSSEGFPPAIYKKKNFLEFKKIVESYNYIIKIIYVVRNNIDMLFSIYIQLIKGYGCTYKCDDMIDEIIKKNNSLYTYKFYLYLVNIFGKENVTPLCYEIMKQNLSFEKKFMEILNIKISNMKKTKYHNISLHSKEVNVMLYINRYYKSLSKQLSNAITLYISKNKIFEKQKTIFVNKKNYNILKEIFSQENISFHDNVFKLPSSYLEFYNDSDLKYHVYQINDLDLIETLLPVIDIINNNKDDQYVVMKIISQCPNCFNL